jgi:uncharacterized protein YlzI (FlbEa/FlbD family)
MSKYGIRCVYDPDFERMAETEQLHVFPSNGKYVSVYDTISLLNGKKFYVEEFLEIVAEQSESLVEDFLSGRDRPLPGYAFEEDGVAVDVRDTLPVVPHRLRNRGVHYAPQVWPEADDFFLMRFVW